MFETYEEALAWIHGRKKMGPKPGIRRMEWLMEKMGHPERKFHSIHIAGTNGKGSNVAYLRSIFMAHHYTVGTFTSPHIVKFNERISVDGEPVSDEVIVDLANRLYPLYREISGTELGSLTEFEVVTAMMFLYFGEHPPDVVLIEVGLGGLFDSTNVALPDVSVITTIGKDHMNILGETLKKIAGQKAGIIKDRTPVVIGNVPDETRSVFAAAAKQKEAPVWYYRQDFQAERLETENRPQELFAFRNESFELKDLQTSLYGAHQVDNAATAVQAFWLFCQKNELPFEKAALRRGLAAASWPGRFETVAKNPLVILDGAHNVPAMEAFVRTVKEKFAGRPVKIVAAFLRDKEIEPMGRLLRTIPQAQFYVTTFDFPRAEKAEVLQSRLMLPDSRVFVDWREAVTEASETAAAEEVVLVTGSLYFISDVRNFLKQNRS